MEWSEWWLTLFSLFWIAGHARCGPLQIVARRTVTAVGARPGLSSFAPIFGASPQYCMLGAPSILRSWVESRDVQISARPVDLVGETELSSEAGSVRLARPKRHPPHGSSPTFLPLGRAAGSSFVFLSFGTAKFSISNCRGFLLATCPLLMGRL